MTTYDQGPTGLLGHLLHWVDALRSRFNNTVELAAAEARLAAMAGVTMLLLVILAAACVVVGWGFLMLALAILAANAGLSWPGVALVMAILHLAGAGALWYSAMRLSRHLTLPATRESLGLGKALGKALGDRDRTTRP
jgi:hypothetical protein